MHPVTLCSRKSTSEQLKGVAVGKLTSIALGFLLLSSFVIAGEVKTGYINSQTVNIRNGPGTRHAVGSRCVQGDQVHIVGEKSGWYQLQLQGKTGWVRKDLVIVKKVKLSFPTLIEKDPSWMNMFKERYSGNIVFQEGGQVEAERLVLVEPEVVEIGQTKVKKTYNLKGEEVFTVTGVITGRGYLNLLSEDTIPVFLQGIIFQKDPGPLLRGNWIVWLGEVSVNSFRSGSREEITLRNSSHFQNWALKEQGVLILIAYAKGIQFSKAENSSSDYYILGVNQSSFKLK
jgi:hypothetical protein